MLRLWLATIFVTISGCVSAQERILVAAASDLKFAMDSVIQAYMEANPGSIEVTYGSSGKLSEQIIHGAPFDIFFSADISYAQQISKSNKTASDIYPYAKGYLVLWSSKIDPNLKKMKSLIEPTIVKVAIANPKHAPYGKRAVESLEYFKLMQAVRSKLVYGENISQTAQFAATGAADIGIIALSLALSPNMQVEKGKYFLIPENSYQPLIQGAVITTHGKNKKLAKSFFEFIKSVKAIDIFKHFGFSQPD